MRGRSGGRSIRRSPPCVPRKCFPPIVIVPFGTARFDWSLWWSLVECRSRRTRLFFLFRSRPARSRGFSRARQNFHVLVPSSPPFSLTSSHEPASNRLRLEIGVAYRKKRCGETSPLPLLPGRRTKLREKEHGSRGEVIFFLVRGGSFSLLSCG